MIYVFFLSEPWAFILLFTLSIPLTAIFGILSFYNLLKWATFSDTYRNLENSFYFGILSFQCFLVFVIPFIMSAYVAAIK